MEPAHSVAYRRITKAQVAFPGIVEAFRAVEKHLQTQGEQITGAPQEINLADWSQRNDDHPARDIAFPYEDQAKGMMPLEIGFV